MPSATSTAAGATKSIHDKTRLSIWQKLRTVRVNPANNKCTTLPIFRLDNPYSVNFHLSWLGFWVAFLSWFAFAPLVPEAVKEDLSLTSQQLGNSNIIALCATLIVRVIVGPLVDYYGPRKVMAALLILGAFPSGLAGLVTSAEGLYAIRFFIGILGGTFVPCQTWTTTFFDTSVVGRANALVAGWGNSGGGFTFIIMVGLFDRLREDGLSSHSSWRAAFAIVPVPVLLTVAVLTLCFGTDHPNGKWADRHKSIATIQHESPEELSEDVERGYEKENVEKHEAQTAVKIDLHEVKKSTNASRLPARDGLLLSWKLAWGVVQNPLTWLPAFAYLTSFGYELALDANLANVLFGLYKGEGFGQTRCGYLASIYGMLNIITRPLGGYLGDVAYKSYGVPGKKYLVLGLGLLQGVLSLAWGLYMDRSTPSLSIVIVLMVLTASFDELANGANFSLVPHCNPGANGVMTGIVGALGNAGGVFFALVFRSQPAPFGRAFWISGIVTMVLSTALVGIRVPRK